MRAFALLLLTMVACSKNKQQVATHGAASSPHVAIDQPLRKVALIVKEVEVIDERDGNATLAIVKVDGRPMPAIAEVMPGEHQLEWSHPRVPESVTQMLPHKMEVKAGRVYALQLVVTHPPGKISVSPKTIDITKQPEGKAALAQARAARKR